MKTQLVQIVLLLTPLLFYISCRQSQDKPIIEKKILGSWRLDSLNVPSGIVVSAKESERALDIQLLNDEKFTLEWWFSDVGNSYEGTYEISQNPKRGCYTLVLIPDYQHFDSSQVRQYFIYDILEANKQQMVLAEETRFLDRTRKDNSPYTLKYNRLNYMSKTK